LSGGSDPEASWLNTILTRGTALDRISVMQLLVQRSPVHSLSHLTQLLSIMQKKNPRETSSVLEALKMLFNDHLLPPSRKLIPLNIRPFENLKKLSGGNEENLRRRLVLWKFESDLKKIYEKFVSNLERLLSMLVNKLGHPNNKFVNKVCGYLIQLCRRQPNMRPVIVREVEYLIFRKNVACRTQLHAISFLSQIQITRLDFDCASSLLRIYFGLFRELVAKGKLDDKILSVLLSATNRVIPFLKGITIYSDLLVFSGMVPDRFYGALYHKLLCIHNHSSQERPLLSLLYNVLKMDSVDSRVIAFIKRLLQLSLSRSACFAGASLILLSRLFETRPNLLIFTTFVDSLQMVISVLFIVIRNDTIIYDPYSRNPVYASADRSVAAELLLLAKHYHPSIAIFASNLMARLRIRYDGDPLMNFTSMQFLDRFVYKNPRKKKVDEKGHGFRKAYNPSVIKKLPVTSEAYVMKKRDEIPVDERFIHRYTAMQASIKKEATFDGAEDVFNDIESVNSEEFDMLLSHFEPGDNSGYFEIDFAKEFGREKDCRKRKRGTDDFQENSDSCCDNDSSDTIDYEGDQVNSEIIFEFSLI
uniref:CBF domain-containing protein n=1 Tax=Dracunculus medinensis TaxID=318479 RepID=A0A0N4UPK5_DRAME